MSEVKRERTSVGRTISTNSARRATTITAFALGAPWLSATANAQIEFDSPVNYPMITVGASVTVHELTGDEQLDVAVTLRWDAIQFLRNQGGGELEPLLRTPYLPSEPRSIVSADLDGDGDVDVAWVDLRRSELHVVFNRGSGAAGRYDVIDLVPNAHSLIAANVDGDRDVDLIVGTHSTVAVYKNDGRGRFTFASSTTLPEGKGFDLAAGDLDRDGDVDVATLSADYWVSPYYGMKVQESHLNIMFNDGSGRFPTNNPVALPYGNNDSMIPQRLEFGDVDNDGDLDVAVLVEDGSGYGPPDPSHVRLMMSENRARWFETGDFLRLDQSYPGQEGDVLLNDLDSDGDIDIAASNVRGPSLAIFENLGGATFSSAQFVQAGNSVVYDMTSDDLDGDGRLDLILAATSGVATLRNISPANIPALSHGPIVRGSEATFSVAGATEGELVEFYFTFTGAGNGPGQDRYGGLVLDLNEPVTRIGAAVTDANGVATLTVDVPINAPLGVIATQAAIRRGDEGELSVKSNPRTSRVRD